MGHSVWSGDNFEETRALNVFGVILPCIYSVFDYCSWFTCFIDIWFTLVFLCCDRRQVVFSNGKGVTSLLSHIPSLFFCGKGGERGYIFRIYEVLYRLIHFVVSQIMIE